MMINRNKIEVIGCGNWGKNLIRNFAELGVLAAVHDNKENTAKSMAAQYNTMALSLAEILANKDITGVVIATPPKDHSPLAKQALLAGKHIFVEKPLALNLSEAEEIASLAKSRNLTLMVGHLLQYHPAFIYLKEAVLNGKLGEITSTFSSRLILNKIRVGEDCILDLAPHDLSMILSLTQSQPILVNTNCSSNIEKDIIDTASIGLKFLPAITAKIFVSWVYPFKEQKFVVIGSKGMMVFDDNQPWESKLVHHKSTISWQDNAPNITKETGKPIPLQPAEPLKLECQHFLDCITTGQTPITDSCESITVMKVLEKVQSSLKS